jgi:hypothetical protein
MLHAPGEFVADVFKAAAGPENFLLHHQRIVLQRARGWDSFAGGELTGIIYLVKYMIAKLTQERAKNGQSLSTLTRILSENPELTDAYPALYARVQLNDCSGSDKSILVTGT